MSTTMCLICGSKSVPAGRDGRGGGPAAVAPARHARRLISICSSRSHTIAPPSVLIVAISSHAASEHVADRRALRVGGRGRACWVWPRLGLLVYRWVVTALTSV